MKNGICPKCHLQNVAKDVRVIDRGEGNSANDFSVAIYINPDALLFRGQTFSPLNAYVCRLCGYTELYVADLNSFNEDYDQIQSS